MPMSSFMMQVLDVGSGSGYLTAIMAHMVRDGQEGKVVGLEHIPELAARGKAAAQRIQFADQMLRDGTLEYIIVSCRPPPCTACCYCEM